MRSILKSRRKSDSSIHELSLPPDTTARKPPRLMKVASSTRLTLSPTSHSNTVLMTPPQNVIGGSVSSPKKLLTPIKKMFGHHSKQNLLSAGDNLNNVLYGEFEPPKGRKDFKRDYQSTSNLAELQEQAFHEEPPQSMESASPDTFSLPDLNRQAYNKLRQAPGNTLVIEEPVHSSKINSPHVQMTTPENKTFDSPAVSVSDSVEDQELSDCSSQFSFEKGVRGGRNTSVKYYKKKVTMDAPNSTTLANYLNMDDMGFEDDNLSDYDFENNGMSDDDGYGEDFEEDNPESTNRYDDFFSEQTDPYHPESEGDSFLNTEEDESLSFDCGSVQENIRSNNHPPLPQSLSDTTQPILIATDSKRPQEYLAEGAKSPGYDDDFLDSYLEREKLPNGLILATPIEPTLSINKCLDHESLSDSSSCYSGGLKKVYNREMSSPESETQHNDLNMGLGIDFGPADVLQEPSAKSNRVSVLNMMDTLLRIDAQEVNENKSFSICAQSIDSGKTMISDTLPENDIGGLKTVIGEPLPKMSSTKKHDDPIRKKEIRRSLIDMMSTLSRLDSDLEKDANESSLKATKKDVRKSIADMMSTLNFLEADSRAPNEDEHKDDQGDSAGFEKLPELKFGEGNRRRYSWFSNEGNSERHDQNNVFDDNPGHALQLSQDILDEINSIPEDYEFSEHTATEPEDPRGFLRSNSYKNKPLKVVHDFNAQSNKLQLSNRTVTFYKTNTLDPPEYLRLPKSRSPSRVGSTRSATSFHSLDEEFHESDEDRNQEEELLLNNRTNLKANASVRSSSLDPITETGTQI